MFSVIFPGQGSQIVGMAKEFYNNFDLIELYYWSGLANYENVQSNKSLTLVSMVHLNPFAPGCYNNRTLF